MTDTDSFDDLRGRFVERAERVEQFVRDAPDAIKAKYEKQLNAIYKGVSHMQPLGVRSSTLTEKPSNIGVYSEININAKLVGKMKEPETRAQIETALRGTGISSSAVIARIESGADNAALERQWIADDLEKIAKADGLNLERKEDLEVAAAKLDQVHVQLGAALERAEVLKHDSVIEIESRDNFHYDENYVDIEARAIRQQMRADGMSEAQIKDAAVSIDDGIYDKIEKEQQDYLREHPEILATPRELYHIDEVGRAEIVNQERVDEVDKEIQRIMDRSDGHVVLSAAVALDFKQKYPDMPDHLAQGLGQTYATAFEINNEEKIRQSEFEVSTDVDYTGGAAQTEAQDMRMHILEKDYPEIARVIEHERNDKINDPFETDGSRQAYRNEIERDLSDEQVKALNQGQSNVLDQVIDDRLDRLYAAKAYLQSNEATANSEATREVISEIAEEEYDAQRLKHIQNHNEKGQTHG